MRALEREIRFLTFSTAIGELGLVWSDRGVCALMLPEAERGRLEERARRMGARPARSSPEISAVIATLKAWCKGEDKDFDSIRLDLCRATEFQRSVYEAARRIPRGKTATYGELAAAIGKPGAARAVGQALGKNPVALIVPCHRVLASGGAGGFSAEGGVTLKRRLLGMERRVQRKCETGWDGRLGKPAK